MKTRLFIVVSILLVNLLFFGTTASSSLAQGSTFNVNESGDVGDADLSDKVCDRDLNSSGLQCTLRAAIEQANFLAGVDTINLTVSGPYHLTLGQLEANTHLTLNGNGQTIQRTGASKFRIFYVSGAETLTLNNVILRGGEVIGPGGGLYISTNSTVNIHNSTISNNTATTEGGGIRNDGTLNLYNSTISNNQTTGEGGGLYNLATLNIRNSTVSSNTATGIGGGMVNWSGTINMLNSAILSNTTGQYGGGITNSDGIFNVANSTISGNIAGHDGGGIDNTAGGTSNLTHVTITNNIANNDIILPGTGGGIYSYSGVVNLKSCIIARNIDTPGNVEPNFNKPDIGGAIMSYGYNLIGNLGTTNFLSNTIGDKYGDSEGTTMPNPGAVESATPINPLLDDLTGNPAYHPLKSGSLAIDQIPAASCRFISSGANPLFTDNGLVPTDQRGIPRPQALTCDMGAYEFTVPIDLAVTKKASSNPIQRDELLTYTVIITNMGANPATGVVLTDTLPTGIRLISVIPTSPICTQANNVINCQLSSLGASLSWQIIIGVKPTFTGTIVNTANVTANELDTNPLNNTATLTTTVVEGPAKIYLPIISQE